MDPNVALAHFTFANACELRGDVAGAIRGYEAAVASAPDFAEAHGNLGDLYVQTGRTDEALRAYLAAIRAKPDFAAVYSNIAAVLVDLQRFDEAIMVLEAALKLAPNIPEAHANLGQAYRRAGYFSKAIAASRRALELRPDFRDAYLNLAASAYALDAFDVALDASRRAVALDPSSAATQYNLAWLCHATGRYTEAVAASEAAIALRPDYAEAHANLALSLLSLGDFTRGWDEYSWTWRLPAKRVFYPYFDRATLWNGESFIGRELLVTREQGFGDAIQTARYLPAVKARGGRVVLEVAPALGLLFADLPGVDELRIVEEGAMLRDDVDLHVPLFGLPRAFDTDLRSIPGTVPYLRAPRERIERFRSRLAAPGRLRVGLVWSGNPEFPRNADRSCGLSELQALNDVPNIAWFALQQGAPRADQPTNGMALIPINLDVADFADTAAILAQLDLVITVDTSVAHLAGALGRPAWVLLGPWPDWRWQRSGDASPWYPTLRLFRRESNGPWSAVIAAVAAALRKL